MPLEEASPCSQSSLSWEAETAAEGLTPGILTTFPNVGVDLGKPIYAISVKILRAYFQQGAEYPTLFHWDGTHS